MKEGPHNHPAYNDAVRQATEQAALGIDSLVCLDGDQMFVRRSGECPQQATVVCIAQKWDATTVQLRFSGARSEWVKI